MCTFVKTGQTVPLRALPFLCATREEKRDMNSVLPGTGLLSESSPRSVRAEKNIGDLLTESSTAPAQVDLCPRGSLWKQVQVPTWGSLALEGGGGLSQAVLAAWRQGWGAGPCPAAWLCSHVPCAEPFPPHLGVSQPPQIKTE